MKKQREINLKKEKITKIGNLNKIKGGNLNSDNPLNPPGCLQTSAIHVSNGCNIG